ncbi:hypothetical protein [Arthrobacter sp. LjRoot14]|uniref:hypothetical protein n=1 Tax=Arthrobacter sp. LjRoot14 TaxID=3342265 RepID=UPI003ECE40B5
MMSTVGPEDRQSRRARGEATDGLAASRADRNGVEDRLEGRRSYADAVRPARNDDAVTDYDDDTRAYPVPVTAEPAVVADPNAATRETVVAREKEQFGGIKIGSAFFGWLAATGTAVLLTALVAAAGTAVGLATSTDVNEAVNQASADQTVGLVGIIVLLAILFVAYYCGGYVAGRMARFNGAKQGFMVWVWAVIFAILVALLAMIAGERFNILANLNSFPRIPVNEGQLSTTGITAAIVVAVVALIGAVVGGMAGMRFHRKVDRAGFTPVEADADR